MKMTNGFLINRIKTAQVEARKSRNTLAATLLTTLLGEANMVAKNAQREAPTDEEVTAVIKKFLKGNSETQAVLHKAAASQEDQHPAYISADVLGKLAVAQEEQKILESYLPQQLSEGELIQIVSAAISAGTPGNMGALMGFLKANHAGKYDGKLASAAIKLALG
jgi:uncharacterized protein YqeY